MIGNINAYATIMRVWEMPNRYTFKMQAVQDLLKREMSGYWADPFCGVASPAQVCNDADSSIQAEFHLDGLDFLRSLKDESVDGILFDPPYSLEQALRKYKPKHNGTAGRTEYWAKCKDEIARIVRAGGKAICFGWDSTGIGNNRGFKLQHVLLLCHGACHNDTIVTVEKRTAAIQRPLIAPAASGWRE
ncbi:hypothetical protein LCGC14_3018370 [marine sediment metagenome]|uniref:DNA methylase N-4/N-6 domain-containing protein n=1 Tax=marine sediment metagenome TaxID=412755 RepID=A0A0F8Z3P7_9ZZZZ